MKRNVCVYAASSDAVAPAYKEAAQRLGGLLAARGHTLVYGAGNIGLMGEMARAVHAGSGHVIGVIPEKLKGLELAYEEADELIVTDDLRERKAIMEERADAFVAMPGGIGTIEEIIEVLTRKQLGYHNKPLVFLNTNGIYDELIGFIERLMTESFIKGSLRELYRVSPDPEDALDYIDAYEAPEPHRKWF